jgi:predicted dehydrogenase
MQSYGIELVEKPEDMIGRIDGVLVESLAGDPHLERVRPFLEAGIPAFVDKPFACKISDAHEMFDLAAKKKVPLFSSSSLRYAPEVVQYTPPSDHGAVVGAMTYGPASLDPGNPGLFHYGIHAVEMLYALMGPGCQWLACVKDVGTEVAVGHWDGGRIGSVRGLRAGRGGYGFTAFCEKEIATKSVSTDNIYRELLKQIVRMFETGEAPLAPQVTLELVGFILAALESGEHGGKPVQVKV